jgi:tetratricopeptide (TPR) repeat protein
MYAEKFELLEAKIRETVMLVSRLREEKRHLEQENAQLRECLEALEDELQDMREAPGSRPPDFETLLQQLENLQEDDTSLSRPLRTGRVMRELEAKGTKSADEYFQLGTLYERKGQFDEAVRTYRQALELQDDNLEVMQRLAFLLEKLNRDTEASPLWERVWAMREAQPAATRRH